MEYLSFRSTLHLFGLNLNIHLSTPALKALFFLSKLVLKTLLPVAEMWTDVNVTNIAYLRQPSALWPCEGFTYTVCAVVFVSTAQ